MAKTVCNDFDEPFQIVQPTGSLQHLFVATTNQNFANILHRNFKTKYWHIFHAAMRRKAFRTILRLLPTWANRF